ncbi:MAG: NUDIX hydrolase YfcD [Thermodesulfobacteriota bacterium]|jgi:8-oxo-dGTP pyrophosphatase MutT (NUDIX family)
MGTADEIVTIVDAHNTVVGAVPRRQMRANNLPHRSTYILVFTPRGELYVQKRTLTKDVFPGYYDPVAGGVVLAGESYEQGAVRELEEEMGIRNTPLTWLFDFYFENEHTRVWGGTFSCVYEGPLALQTEEIESVTLMTPEEVVRRAAAEPFTPDGLYVVRRYLGQL